MGLLDQEDTIHYQYTIARYSIRLGSTLPKNTLLECTWYLVFLVDAIVCGCTTCCVAACDVLVGTRYISWMLSGRGCTTCCVAVYDVQTDTGTA